MPDEEEFESDFIPVIKRQGMQAAAEDALADAWIRLRKTASGKVVQPTKEVAPLPEPEPIRPPLPGQPELPGIAALKGSPDPWIQAWINALLSANVRTPAQARALSPEPSRVPVRSGATSEERASESERALTQSLASLPATARAHDTGAALPRDAMGHGGGATGLTAGGAQKKAADNRGKGAAVAADALTAAGILYIAGRGGGRGGMHAQESRFRGGAPKDWVHVR